MESPHHLMNWTVVFLVLIAAPLFTETTLNEDQKDKIVKKHNDLRRIPKASDMLKMVWNDDLAVKAQEWANECKFDHSKIAFRTFKDKYPAWGMGNGWAGENLYVGQGDLDVEKAVQNWYDEWKDYKFSTKKCCDGKMCGHYTQVVWAKSKHIGCGVKFCDELEGSSLTKANIVVCIYGPLGNFNNNDPYTKTTGACCSNCPSEASKCDKGLCSDTGSDKCDKPDGLEVDDDDTATCGAAGGGDDAGKENNDADSNKDKKDDSKDGDGDADKDNSAAGNKMSTWLPIICCIIICLIH